MSVSNLVNKCNDIFTEGVYMNSRMNVNEFLNYGLVLLPALHPLPLRPVVPRRQCLPAAGAAWLVLALGAAALLALLGSGSKLVALAVSDCWVRQAIACSTVLCLFHTLLPFW